MERCCWIIFASYDTLTFDYDASGIRTRKGDITYTLDGNRILAETRPTGTIKYFYGTTGVVGFEYNNAKYFYQKNAQGDITAIYDSMGNLKAEYEYDAWGNHVVIVDVDGIGTLNPFRYRGYYYDDETGLYYTKSRYYDPEIGRFISPDNTEILTASPLEHTDKNLYAYCDNNPVSRKDDKGGFWHIVIGAAIGAVANFAASVVTDVILGEKIDWEGAFVSAGIGALEGGLSAAGVPVGVLVAVSAVAGAGESVYSDIKDGKGWDDIGDIAAHAAISAGISALFTASGGTNQQTFDYRSAKEAYNALKAGGLHPKLKKAYEATLKSYLKSLGKFAAESFIDDFISSLSSGLINEYSKLVYDNIK